MPPKPTTEADIWDLINAAEARMTVRQERLWQAIRIMPQRWRQHPYGNLTEGFWVVAILGTRVLWFNEIEGGFNRSHFSRYGLIDEYFCDQSGLEEAVQDLVDIIDTGLDIDGRSRGPLPGEYQG
ncbi:MAG: hypothetical protein AB7O49_03325 [Sphingomonadales bacterium]